MNKSAKIDARFFVALSLAIGAYKIAIKLHFHKKLITTIFSKTDF